MNTAKRRNTAGLKPFKKGDDPRRWKHGQKSKAAVTVSRDIQQWLSLVGEEIYEDGGQAAKGQTYSEALARKLWDRGVKGDMRAVEIVLDRLLGKPTQPLEHYGEIRATVVFEMPRPKRED